MFWNKPTADPYIKFLLDDAKSTLEGFKLFNKRLKIQEEWAVGVEKRLKFLETLAAIDETERQIKRDTK